MFLPQRNGVITVLLFKWSTSLTPRSNENFPYVPNIVTLLSVTGFTPIFLTVIEKFTPSSISTNSTETISILTRGAMENFIHSAISTPSTGGGFLTKTKSLVSPGSKNYVTVLPPRQYTLSVYRL